MRDSAVSHLPIGYGFRPTDEELVGYYLKRKLQGMDSEVAKVIAKVDICKCDPWQLPDLSKIKSDDPEWFFISPSDHKYYNSDRANRTTPSGRWKVTGKERGVTDVATKDIIGKKRTLVFYNGPASGKKTDWVMHEYYVPSKKTFTLFRLKNKSDEKTDSPNLREDEPCNHIDDQAPQVHTSAVVNLESLFNTVQDLDFLASDSHVNHTSGLESLFNTGQVLDFLSSDSHVNHTSGLESLFNTGQVLDFLSSDSHVNHTSGLQSLNGVEWEDDTTTQFLQSDIIDEADYYHEDTSPTHFSDSSLPMSLKRAHVNDGGVSSDTDIEVFQPQPFQDFENPNLFGKPVGSKRSRHMKTVNTLCGSSNLNQLRQTERGSFSSHFIDDEVHDETCRMESATNDDSCIDPFDNHQFMQDSTPENNSHELCSSEDPIVRTLFELRNQTKSVNLVKTVQVQKEVGHTNKVQKLSKSKVAGDLSEGRGHAESWFDSDSESKTVRVTSRKKDLKLASQASSRDNLMGFLTFQGTPSHLSRKSDAPAVYFFNALLGICLFAFFVREVVLYGQWF